MGVDQMQGIDTVDTPGGRPDMGVWVSMVSINHPLPSVGNR